MLPKRLFLALALSIALAHSAAAQKDPNEALGFQPDKLYEFQDLDAVNLFNGNLNIGIPLGPRYPLSQSFGYQFRLAYNGRTWDAVSYDYLDDDQHNYVQENYPNFGSNAGNGWRVSFGRLLPPAALNVANAQNEQRYWIYEGPNGEEYHFGRSWLGDPQQESSNTTYLEAEGALRLVYVNTTEREIQFPNGDVHTFTKLNGKWRFTKMRDAFGSNWMSVAYTFTLQSGVYRESQWTVEDSAGRIHSVHLQRYQAMDDGWSRGAQVTSVELQALPGTNQPRAIFGFTYVTQPVSLGCPSGSPYANYVSTSPWVVPLLDTVTLPDGTSFSMTSYYDQNGVGCGSGAMKSLQLPTGGKVTYTYQAYGFAEEACYDSPWDTYWATNGPTGIASRTVSDGVQPDRTWNYVQRRGPIIPTDFHGASDPCQRGIYTEYPVYGPHYWTRTSVLSPVVNGKRDRSDHYFEVDKSLSLQLPYLTYGLAGAGRIPPDAWAKKNPSLIPENDPSWPADVSALDTSDPAAKRYLAVRAYAGCAADGDCSAMGTLMRSTYISYGPTSFEGERVQADSTRTYYNDDTGCGGATCWSQSDQSDENGAGTFRQTVTTSNFPNLPGLTNTVTSSIVSPSFAVETVRSAAAWNATAITAKSRTENGVTATEQFCFDSLGFLTRHRVLAGASPAQNDVLTVYGRDTYGNTTSVETYGGDRRPEELPGKRDEGQYVQALGTEAAACNASLPAKPWYRIVSSYTNGVLAQSSHYDRDSETALTFFDVDRTIDPVTGVVLSARDMADVQTLYNYNSSTNPVLLPRRLESVTSPTGSITSYVYTNASGSGASLTPARVRVETTTTSLNSTGPLKTELTFDGLGRPFRQAELNAQGVWIASETRFDESGRKAWVSQPESTGVNPPASSLAAIHKTFFTYDSFGRTTRIDQPDAKYTAFAYTGARKMTRTTQVAQASGETNASTTETYDSQGRLIQVDEAAGPGSANVATQYSFDIGGRLKSVAMSGEGVTQNRTFTYDNRGFLLSETNPENGNVTYESYDPQGHARIRRQTTAPSIFNQKYEFDSAGRLVAIETGAPYWSPGSYLDEFRPHKSWTYATDNDGTNKRRGKLEGTLRINHPAWTPDYQAGSRIWVYETYRYDRPDGRTSERTTKIYSGDNGQIFVKEVKQTFAWNDLGLPSEIRYPTCVNCSVPPVADPERKIPLTYSRGQLTAINGYVGSIVYDANGGPSSIVHSSGITDTIAADPNGMARPKSITFGSWSTCGVPPSINAPIPDQARVAGETATLVVGASGSSLSYQWYTGPKNAAVALTGNGATTASYTTGPLTAGVRTYWVRVTNACRFVDSNEVTITVPDCQGVAITAQPVAQTIGSGQTATLSVSTTGTDPRHYQWYRGASGDTSTPVGTDGPSFTTPALTSTTSYWVAATNACGQASSATATVTVLPPLAAPTGLVASRASSTSVLVSWNAVSGAAKYQVWRRSGGSFTLAVTVPSATSWTDTNRSSAVTYVYEVRAVDANDQRQSAASNRDLVTMMAFSSIVAGVTAMDDAYVAEVFNALNMMRAANGDATTTWANILSAGVPAPAVGVANRRAHIEALRSAYDAARSALGVANSSYTDPNLSSAPVIRAVHVQQLQERAQ